MGRIYFQIIHFVIYECGANAVLDLQGLVNNLESN